MKAFRHILVLSALLILALFTYIGVRDFEFVNWDDQIQVVSNQDITTVDGQSLIKMFSTFYAGMYQPLTTLSYAADYALYGGAIPSGFHLSSLILHLLNIILMYILVRKLGLSDYLSGFITLIFALHPVQVEAVAWVSARSTLLFTFFYLLALIRYASFAENRNVMSVITAFIFFMLSLLSKPSAASFFLMIPVIEYWFFPRLTFRTLLRMLLFALPAAIMLFVTFYSRGDAGVVQSYSQQIYTPLQHAGFAFWSVLLYITDAFYPFSQHIVRLYPEFQYYLLAIPLLLTAIVIYAFIRLKSYRKYILLSVGMFLVPLSVHLKFIPFGDMLMADRYMYLSIAGAFMIPLCFFTQFAEKQKGTMTAIAGLLLIISVAGIFAYQSYQRKETWKNSTTLWSHVISQTPHYYLGYYNRGIAYRDRGRHPEAIRDFTEALRCHPEFAEAYLARGTAFSATGNFMKAISDFDIVLRLQPDLHASYLNRANAFYNSGEFISAVKDYKIFLKSEPMHEQASFYLILSMIRLDYEHSELLSALNDFIEKFPGNPEGYYFRGILTIEENRVSACEDFNAAAGMGNNDAKMMVINYCL